MLSTFQRYGFYLLLLPVFFVLHGCLQNYGFITLNEGIELALVYLAYSLVVGFIGWLFFRNVAKACLTTFAIMGFYFFFGALHDFLKVHVLHFFSSYSVLLSTYTILLVLLVIYLKKRNPNLGPLTAFLNVLFVVYLLIDMGGLVSKKLHPAANKLSIYSFAGNSGYTHCDSCSKPNIYFLLMDEYASSASLEQDYHYHNTTLDSFLQARHFSVQTHSRSNYNFTIFSMASMLNMNYLQGIKNPRAIDVNDYANCEQLILNNEVIKRLTATGYDIYNYSIFNLAGHPTRILQSFLPLNTLLITEQTLLARMRKDIGWKLAAWYPFKWFWGMDIMLINNNNNTVRRLVEERAAAPYTTPRFVYAHFYMPHHPYYYNNKNEIRSMADLVREKDLMPLPSYLNYLPHVNACIMEMIDSIQQHDPRAVIVLMGDHGHRGTTNEIFPARFFKNLNAVYFPDKDYHLLYDSISAVNQFRVVFNKLFNQGLPLLKDSSVIISEKGNPGAMN